MIPENTNTGTWRRSSRSTASGDNCVEVATVPWLKSSRSSGSGDNCVEVGPTRGRVAIRDSKHPYDGMLVLNRAGWRSLVSGIKSGHYNLV